MQTPDNNQHHGDDALEAPPELVAALKRLPKEPVFIPPTADEAVLRAARKHLEGPQHSRPSWFRFMPWAVAAAAVVLLVAQPVLQNQWGSLLGGTRTHHIVLLDDSFSMSDRWADTDAFAEAKKVVGRIAADAARLNQPQSFTLLRFSRSGQPPQAAAADLLKQPILAQIPLDDRVVPLSTNNGEPFILQDRTKPVARAILEMAQAIKTRLVEIAQSNQEERKPAAMAKVR